MRMQSSEANCGSTSFHNALKAIGIHRELEECERLCGTNAQDGTSEFGLIDAIASIGRLAPIVLHERSYNNLYKLGHFLREGRPAVLCVDDDEHYIAAIGLLGSRVLIADSASIELVESWTETELVNRWSPNYWGVII